MITLYDKRILKRLIRFYKTHNWTQNEDARDKYGHPVDMFSKKAKAFCLSAACHKLEIRHSDLMRVIIHGVKSPYGDDIILADNSSIESFNDYRLTSKKRMFSVFKQWLKGGDA